MYLTVHRTILFREEHSARVLVPRVDHVSAPGISSPGTFRRGHAQALVTGRCVFRFDPTRARFSLASLHPGETRETVRAATGFDYDEPADIATTAGPTEAQAATLAGPVCDAMIETYPDFCRRVWGREAKEEAA
jgi:glutaconate CoA-transferase subunit B